MTEKRALILDVVGGCLVTWGSVFLLSAVGAAEKFKVTAGLLGIVVFSFMVGVIGDYYRRKAIAEGKDPDDRFR
jgi:high-affinity Fe2+/Pb2+ permease